MDSNNGGVEVSNQCSMSLLAEGISLILSRWTLFQLVLSEERNPQPKSARFADDILSWFTNSKELYIDDLEDLIDESISHIFEWGLDRDENGEVNHDIKEVAYHLMVIHQECLQGKCDSVEKLRKSSTRGGAVSQSKQVTMEDFGESLGAEATDMVVGNQNTRETVEAEDMVASDQNPRKTVEAEDMVVDDDEKPREAVQPEEGWTVVSSSKQKHKRRTRQ